MVHCYNKVLAMVSTKIKTQNKCVAKYKPLQLSFVATLEVGVDFNLVELSSACLILVPDDVDDLWMLRRGGSRFRCD